MSKGILIIVSTVLVTFLIWLAGLTNIQLTLNLVTRFYAVIGIILLSWNYILSTRTKLLEELFDGLDHLYAVHHWIGQWGFLFILSHPLTLLLNAIIFEINIKQYLLPGINVAYSFGVLAIYLLIILLIVTIFIKLPYHLWKLSHDFMGIPLFILSIHILLIPSDVSRNFFLRYWILAFVVTGLISYLYKRFVYEKFNKYEYSIDEIKNESDSIIALRLKKLTGDPKYFPGAFIFLKRNEGQGNDELHPFSITSFDEKGNVTLGIKKEGDYTNTIQNWRVGENIRIFGPYGRFGSYFQSNRKELWMAGGIGITPFLGILDSYLKSGKEINSHLIYSLSDVTIIPFEDDLKRYSQNIKGFTYEIWDNKSKGWFSPKEYIKPDIEMYLICASDKGTKSIIKELKSSGVNSSKIRKEQFKLY